MSGSLNEHLLQGNTNFTMANYSKWHWPWITSTITRTDGRSTLVDHVVFDNLDLVGEHPLVPKPSCEFPSPVCWASGFGSWDHTFTQLQPLTAWSWRVDHWVLSLITACRCCGYMFKKKDSKRLVQVNVQQSSMHFLKMIQVIYKV